MSERSTTPAAHVSRGGSVAASHAASSIPTVLRCGQAPESLSWKTLLLETRVAGVPVLDRHLLAFDAAGLDHVTLVVPGGEMHDLENVSRRRLPAGLTLTVCSDDAAPTSDAVEPLGSMVLEQRADTLVDPRLISQLVRLANGGSSTVCCLDRSGGNTVEAKSPFRVGVADRDEAKVVGTIEASGLVPIGLSLRATTPTAETALAIGRYYWQRIASPGDAAIATRQVLQATMKPTDGVHAQINRRVSLQISQALVDTRVTPNMVTIATLIVGIFAGWLLSHGAYQLMLAGSVTAWVASMLDGVDGELARAKFQSTALGHWLEMACDYGFYISLVVGLGSGLARVTGNSAWAVLGGASVAGIVASFAVVAGLKRKYTRDGTLGDFYLAFQHTFEALPNPVLRFVPHLAALATRASLPYYTVIFIALQLSKPLMILLFIGAQVFWLTGLWASGMRLTMRSSPVTVIDQSRT